MCWIDIKIEQKRQANKNISVLKGDKIWCIISFFMAEKNPVWKAKQYFLFYLQQSEPFYFSNCTNYYFNNNLFHIVFILLLPRPQAFYGMRLSSLPGYSAQLQPIGANQEEIKRRRSPWGRCQIVLLRVENPCLHSPQILLGLRFTSVFFLRYVLPRIKHLFL